MGMPPRNDSPHHATTGTATRPPHSSLAGRPMEALLLKDDLMWIQPSDIPRLWERPGQGPAANTATDCILLEPHPHLQEEQGTATTADMAPLPPIYTVRSTVQELLHDPFSIWIIGVICGLILSFVALEISLHAFFGVPVTR